VTTDTDLAIVGSGFGGSVLAMIARRLGRRVVLLERGRHPRFAIGESASPLAGILIEQLADRYDLPRLWPLSAFGTWQQAYPHLTCGLKRGFTFFRHEPGQPYAAAADRSNQVLVAASPCDALSDTHWLRSEVDHFLVQEATDLGAEYLDGVQLDTIEWRSDGHATVRGARAGVALQVRAAWVVDASGPRGFLSRALGLVDRADASHPRTQALYTHFVDVARCADMPAYAVGDPAETPPYPMDAAAVHHVFDGGWMWVLRFGNGLVSAGVAVEDWLATDLRLSDGAPAWARLLARHPSLAAQFSDARPVREFAWVPRLAYRASAAAGEGWALLPSAAAFADPMFSAGIPLTLLGIERLARILEATTVTEGRASPPSPSALTEYGRVTLAEADLTAAFLAGCYAAFPRFEQFAAYSMCYFAAASYAELTRRCAPDRPSIGFLGAAEERLVSAITDLSPQRRPGVSDEDGSLAIAAALDPWNIAGLCDPTKRNWYGVDLEDAVRGAAKLGQTPEAVRDCLAKLFQGH
jgi:FADH2 O2-dependent halogenase